MGLLPSKVMYSTHCCISLHRAAAHVAADVRLAAQLLAEVEELVRAEMVVLGDPAPVGVDHRRPLSCGPMPSFQ